MRLFVAMPFGKHFERLYATIRKACQSIGLEPVRADELLEPGPIINQIVREIGDADFVLAEVSSKSPNVFYEVGMAHCVRKPTLLLAAKDAVKDLPFDVRHNRVLEYDRDDPESMSSVLVEHLKYFAEHYGGKGATPPHVNDSFENLAAHRQRYGDIDSYIAEVGKDFHLKEPELVNKKYISEKEGYLLTVRDYFHNEVAFSVDPNGIVRNAKRL